MKRGWGALIAALVLVAFITPALTSARFTSQSPFLDSQFSVGSFSPPTSPIPTVTLEGTGVRLAWTSVAFSGTSTVAYRVRRTNSDGLTSDVCTDLSSQTIVNGAISCLDSSLQVGSTYTYAIQPTLVRNGTNTWNLAYGQESSPVAIPGLMFAGAGPIVNTTTAGLVNVPYPTGTEIGDLLVLVVVNGRNRAPKRLTAWTDIVSRGIGGTSDFHLYSAQRIADGSSAVAVDMDTGIEGASLQVFRYDVPVGSPAPIVRASQVQSGFSTTATVQLVPTPDIITTAAATAISIVAVRANNGLSVVPGSTWTLRSASVTVPGTTSLAWAIADTAIAVATTISSPTWQQSGTPARWLYGGSAFG